MINICKIYLNYLRNCENLIVDIEHFYRENNRLPHGYYKLQAFEYKILNIDLLTPLETCTDIVNNEILSSEIVYMQLSLPEIPNVHWPKYIFTYKNIIFVFDFEIFKRAKQEKKVIVSKTWLFEPNSHYYDIFINNSDYIEQHVTLNILHIPEISSHNIVQSFFPAIDLPNTIFIGQTTIFKHALNIPFQWWLLETTHVNIKSWVLHRQLDLLNYNVKKPIFFDCLLGKPKQHRTSFYQKILQNNLKKYCYISTHNWPKELTYQNSNSFSIPKKFEEVVKKEYPELKFLPDKINANRVIVDKLLDSTCKFTLGDTYLSLSQFIDLDLYNQTAYSVVAETHSFENFYGENETYFMTEKICKPILAKRMFLVVGVTNFLHHLRNLGFKTFDTVIDESYDKVVDDNLRQHLVIQEMKKLVSIEQEVILQKIEPIVQHNFYHLMKLYYDDDLNYLLNQFL